MTEQLPARGSRASALVSSKCGVPLSSSETFSISPTKLHSSRLLKIGR